MKNIFRTLVISSLLCLTACIQPKTTEVEMKFRSDGTVHYSKKSFDMCSLNNTTNKALGDFIDMLEDYAPINTETERDGNLVYVEEYSAKYGGLFLLEEMLVSSNNAAIHFNEMMTNGYYTMEFDSDDFLIQSNGELYNSVSNTSLVEVRWPTNTAHIWYRTTLKQTNTIELIGFWQDFGDANYDLDTFKTNMVLKGILKSKK